MASLGGLFWRAQPAVVVPARYVLKFWSRQQIRRSMCIPEGAILILLGKKPLLALIGATFVLTLGSTLGQPKGERRANERRSAKFNALWRAVLAGVPTDIGQFFETFAGPRTL